MRAALVATGFSGSGGEQELFYRRLAGALAYSTDLTVLSLAPSSEGIRGFPFDVKSFPTELNPRRARALLEASSSLDTIPRFIQEEVARAEGGFSLELLEDLKKEAYDVVVFCGYKYASTVFGIHAVTSDTRVVLVPSAIDDPLFWLPTYDAVFKSSDRILVSTKSEQALVSRRLGGQNSGKIINVKFALRINQLSMETNPWGESGGSYIVASGNSLDDETYERTVDLGALVTSEYPDVRVMIVERNPDRRRPHSWLERRRLASRADLWRWSAKALAFLDAQPGRVIGRDALEAQMCGTPIIASRYGWATREHAEVGDGGLWFDLSSELLSCIDKLLEPHVRDALANQGREYALSEYGDPDTFVKSVTEAIH